MFGLLLQYKIMKESGSGELCKHATRDPYIHALTQTKSVI